jgi:hypothetical protein
MNKEKQEEMNNTGEKMLGVWHFSKDGLEQRIEIGHENAVVITKEDENPSKEESFPAGAHWFGDQLSLLDSGQKYFIKYADDEHMIFGENEPIGTTTIKWSRKFTRLN